MTSLNFLFQEALQTPGYQLSQFYRTTIEDIFPEAQYQPEPLKHYASSGDRFIKEFLNNPHSSLRIFYFQLLRLCYTRNHHLVHTLPYLNRLKKVILNPEFSIIFSFDTEEKSHFFNNHQFKKLFAEFIDYLDYEEELCVESAVNNYPIIDIVMIHIMRSLLVTKDINPDFNEKIETKIVFKELSDIFKLKLSSWKDYWVFEDSEFIVHAESEWEIYISYRESRENQEKIRGRRKGTGLLGDKPVEDVVTSLSIKCQQDIVKEKHKKQGFLSPSQFINNIMSPKQRTFNKMFPHPQLCFTSTNILNSKLPQTQTLKQQQSKSQLKIIPNNNNIEMNTNKAKKLNPQCSKGSIVKTQSQIKEYYGGMIMRKGGNMNTGSLAYFKGLNKQNNANINSNLNKNNNPTFRNVSLESKREVSRSKSFCRGVAVVKTKFFKAK